MVLNFLLILVSTVNLADTLIQKGFYNKAIVEYNRELFYGKEDSVKIFNDMANLFYKTEKYPLAARYYSMAFAISHSDITKYKLYRSMYKNNQYDILTSLLSGAEDKRDSILFALSLGKLHNYGESSRILKDLNYNIGFSNPYFNKYISYIVPGSGQILAGHLKDGLVALVVNGAFAYYGYYLYKKGDYLTFILTIPLFLRYYTGNATAAWEFTIDKNDRIIDNLESSIGIF